MNIQIKTDFEESPFRKKIGDEIERLILLLDSIDRDCDLEETGDEHDNGMPDGWRRSYLFVGDEGDNRPFVAQSEDDEDGNDAEQDDSDREPDLGWQNHREDQTAPCGFGHGGEEFSATGHHGIWGTGDSENDDDEEGHDREWDLAEHGVADKDALNDIECYMPISQALIFDGSGEKLAGDMLRSIGVAMKETQ